MSSWRRWSYHPELLATPVPRYTSFPTAAEFHEGVAPKDMERALDELVEGQDISLYLHIPYCHEICWYCGCNTGAANKRGRLNAYVESLRAEIELLSARIGPRVRIARIAWGGGSPNALTTEDFIGLTRQLHSSFECSTAVTSMELDPRSFDTAWGEAMEIASVSRVSLGVQTFSPRIQALIGRVQPTALIDTVVSSLRRAGVVSLNFDLMYGLPGQSLSDLSETIRKTLALAPERLAVFGYAHVPHLLPRQRRIDASALPGPQMRFRQAERAALTFQATGYESVGFDHFAKPYDALARATRNGVLRRNFQGFTEDQSDTLIGLGASAISSFRGALLQNEKNAGRYRMRVGAGQFATARGFIKSADDQLRARAVEALLCQQRADLSVLPELQAIRERTTPFVDHGLVRWIADELHLSAHASPYARSIASILDPYRLQSSPRFSSAI